MHGRHRHRPTSVTGKPGVSQEEPTTLSPDSRQTDRAMDATTFSLRRNCSPRSFLPAMRGTPVMVPRDRR